MTYFESATYAVREALAHASDDQLAFSRLTTRHRDALLEREVAFIPKHNAPYAAAFLKEQSYKQRRTVIAYDILHQVNPANALVSAAHEEFHAARFWGEREKHYQTHTRFLAIQAGLFVGLIAAQACFNIPKIIPSIGNTCLSTTTVSFGLILRHTRRKEEKDAHRFGYLFDPGVYIPSFNPLDEKKTSLRKKISHFIDGYPTREEALRIFYRTKAECINLVNGKPKVDHTQNLYLEMVRKQQISPDGYLKI